MSSFLEPVSRGRVRIKLFGDKAYLDCAVIETWQPIIHEVIRCGAKQSFELTRTVGVKRTDVQAMEGSSKASIGVGGIAKLESSVKGSLKTELTLSEEVTTKRTVEFTSPECGHYRALQYQALRTYKLEYRDTRFLHRDSWSQTLTEYTVDFHDASKKVDSDPDCGCKHKTGRDYDGLFEMVFGSVSKLIGFHGTDDGLLLDLDQKTVKVRMDPGESKVVRIRAEWLPEQLLFLIDQPDVEVFEASVVPLLKEDLSMKAAPEIELIEEQAVSAAIFEDA